MLQFLLINILIIVKSIDIFHNKSDHDLLRYQQVLVYL
jgi:hypothetical protein